MVISTSTHCWFRKTDVSAGTLADDQISGDKLRGTIASTTIVLTTTGITYRKDNYTFGTDQTINAIAGSVNFASATSLRLLII